MQHARGREPHPLSWRNVQVALCANNSKAPQLARTRGGILSELPGRQPLELQRSPMTPLLPLTAALEPVLRRASIE